MSEPTDAVTRQVYAARLAQARAYLATLTPGSEEYERTVKHIADLEATGHHLPKD